MAYDSECSIEHINAGFDSPETILVAAQQAFHHDESRPVPTGLRILWRAQYHLNAQRIAALTARRKEVAK